MLTISCLFVCVINDPLCPGVDHEKLVKLAEKNFSGLPTTYDLPDLEPCRYSGSLMTVRDDDMPYAHLAIAVEVHDIVHCIYSI